MAAKQNVVTVFGSARVGRDTAEYGEARSLGRELTECGLVVCSGGYGGVMEAVSRGACEAGGRAIGVLTTRFRARPNAWLACQVKVRTWEERLFELVRRGRGYVVCPGGTGTLVELAVVWEMLNKGFMGAKPFVLLGSFWAPVIERVLQAELGRSSEGGRNHARVFYQAASPADAARHMAERLRRTPQRHDG